MTQLVVTHPGEAHRDEFLSCCFLIADKACNRIERRKPTEAELDCEHVFVVDVGERYEPDLNNYDHHQLPREHEPTCSITLLLPQLLISLETARRVWKWLSFTELLDSKGPTTTAKEYGIAPDRFIESLSPIETTVLRWFATHPIIEAGMPLFALMELIGREKLEYLDEVITRMESLRDGIKQIQPREGVGVWLDATHIPWDKQPIMGLEEFIRAERLDVPVTITQDNHGTGGFALFRRNDDPRVDFSRLEGREDIVYAHKGGFLAKTRPDANPVALIQAAWVAD